MPVGVVHLVYFACVCSNMFMFAKDCCNLWVAYAVCVDGLACALDDFSSDRGKHEEAGMGCGNPTQNRGTVGRPCAIASYFFIYAISFCVC